MKYYFAGETRLVTLQRWQPSLKSLNMTSFRKRSTAVARKTLSVAENHRWSLWSPPTTPQPWPTSIQSWRWRLPPPTAALLRDRRRATTILCLKRFPVQNWSCSRNWRNKIGKENNLPKYVQTLGSNTDAVTNRITNLKLLKNWAWKKLKKKNVKINFRNFKLKSHEEYLNYRT